MPLSPPANEPLQQRVARIVERSIRLIERDAELAPLHAELMDCRARLRQPMRVAIVGLTNAGKSTLLNALLGEVVVPTGPIENTYNITWLRHGAEPSVTIHYKAERPPQTRQMRDLAGLVQWGADRQELGAIRLVDVTLPNPFLQRFHLIDTPGFASALSADTENTRRFLETQAGELTSMTAHATESADAILYLFSQGIHTADERVVEQFLGPASGKATPINSIGVLTKVDHYWQPGTEGDPIADAATVTTRLRGHPKVRSLFHSVLPVSGQLALGASTLTGEQFVILQRLATMPGEQVQHLMSNIERFAKRETPQLDIPGVARERLAASLGMYGIQLGSSLLRARPCTTFKSLQVALFDHSGLAELRELLTAHFGNRVDLIKTERAFRRIERTCFHEMRNGSSVSCRTAARIGAAFSSFRSGEHGYAELDVLRSFYNGKLALRLEEVEDLLHVTGERGTSLPARLGCPSNASASALTKKAAERNAYWRLRLNNYTPLASDMRFAAKTLVRSFELILLALSRLARTS